MNKIGFNPSILGLVDLFLDKFYKWLGKLSSLHSSSVLYSERHSKQMTIRFSCLLFNPCSMPNQGRWSFAFSITSLQDFLHRQGTIERAQGATWTGKLLRGQRTSCIMDRRIVVSWREEYLYHRHGTSCILERGSVAFRQGTNCILDRGLLVP